MSTIMILDYDDASILTSGLQCPCVCDEARQVAHRMADELDYPVVVVADDAPSDEDGVVVEPGTTGDISSADVGCCSH